MLDRLPDDVVLLVGDRLGWRDLLALRQVCRRLQTVLMAQWERAVWRIWHLPGGDWHQMLACARRTTQLLAMVDRHTLAMQLEVGPEDTPMLVAMLADEPCRERQSWLTNIIEGLRFQRGLELLLEPGALVWSAVDLLYNKHDVRGYQLQQELLEHQVPRHLHNKVYLQEWVYHQRRDGVIQFAHENEYLDEVLRVARAVVWVFEGHDGDAHPGIEQYCLLQVVAGRGLPHQLVAMAVIYDQLRRFFGQYKVAVAGQRCQFDGEVLKMFIRVGTGYFFVQPKLRHGHKRVKVYRYTLAQVRQLVRTQLYYTTQQIDAFLKPVTPQYIVDQVSAHPQPEHDGWLREWVGFVHHAVQAVSAPLKESGAALFRRHLALQTYITKPGNYVFYLAPLLRAVSATKRDALVTYFSSIESLRVYGLPQLDVEWAQLVHARNQFSRIVPGVERQLVEITASHTVAARVGTIDDNVLVVAGGQFRVVAPPSIAPVASGDPGVPLDLVCFYPTAL